MANKITYNDKAPFQNDPDIPDDNKVLAKNMNEIKTVVNANADELDTAKENIENLQGGQGTSNADITSLKNRVSTLETDNTTNKSNITNLQSNKVDKVEGKGLSTEDFTTELKSKLESLENYDDTEIKEDISNLEAEQIEQNEQIDILINALPSETQESENINIKGTIPTKFKEFKLSGNSKQETRSGKNLLYVPDQTVELNGFKVTVKDGKYTVEDNRETGIFVAIVLATNFTLKAGTYTISNGRNQNYPYVNLRSNGSAVGDSTMSGGDNGVKTITIAEDIVVDTIAIYAGTNTKITEIFPQLEEGTQATDYEPYGAMPSPEYPSEIQNVEGNVDITVCNKNTFNSKKIPSGSIITVNDDQSITLKNNTNASGYVNTGVKLKDICKGLKSGNTTFLKIITTFENKYIYLAGINQLWNDETSKILTEEMLESTVVLYGGYQKIDILKIQISLNKLEEYVEHQQQTITFPLEEGQKLMKGDYLADDGIHHVRKQVELVGTDFSLYSSQVAGRTIYLISNFSNNNNFKTYDSSILCNILKQGTSSNGNNYLNNNGSSGSLYVSIENSILGITDESTNEEKLQAFQNLIAETGFVYEGELAEEEIEAYTPEQQEAYNQLINLKAYEEETNVYSTNSTSPIFKVTAVQSTNAVLTQMKQLILEGGN